MANEEQLSILKQGVEVWNKWRADNHGIDVDLRKANLRGVNLRGANLNASRLLGANLREADLSGAHLILALLLGTDLREANLSGADLRKAHIELSDLSKADIRGADLSEAALAFSYLHDTRLSKTNLSGANLHGTDLLRADLSENKFSSAKIGFTNFGKVDLSSAMGLNETDHEGPSTVGTDTIARSRGKIPEKFLRGCGLSDWEVEEAKLYNPDLSNEEINKILYKIYDLRATQALQVSPLFISYSHSDSAFVNKLESQLSEKGIRFWRDIHDMKAGRIEAQIDRAISQNRTVLLVLSEHSLNSDWVEHEVRTARGLEKDMGRDVLCPVALDDSWKSSPWPKRVMEQVMEYNILDFSAWKDDVKFEGMFRKLIDGLELFYKG